MERFSCLAGGNVHSKSSAGLCDRFAEKVIAEDGDEGNLVSKQRKIVGNVSANAAKGSAHPSGVGIFGAERGVGGSCDIQVVSAYYADFHISSRQRFRR